MKTEVAGDHPDFEKERARMIELQLKARGIQDKRVLDAMGKVPRHEFFSRNEYEYGYRDSAWLIGCGQTISQPFIVALMTAALGLEGGEKVLEVGTGSGYQTAILAELSKEVYSVERFPELAASAKKRLLTLGYKNISVMVGDGSIGLAEEAPFDAILVTAAAPVVPDCLIAQLRQGARLVIPVGSMASQSLLRVEKSQSGYFTESMINCLFVPLVGEAGWH